MNEATDLFSAVVAAVLGGAVGATATVYAARSSFRTLVRAEREEADSDQRRDRFTRFIAAATEIDLSLRSAGAQGHSQQIDVLPDEAVSAVMPDLGYLDPSAGIHAVTYMMAVSRYNIAAQLTLSGAADDNFRQLGYRRAQAARPDIDRHGTELLCAIIDHCVKVEAATWH